MFCDVLKYLNNHVDLHIGGIDLRFPHHENERAQSNPMVGGEAVTLVARRTPFIRRSKDVEKFWKRCFDQRFD